MTDRTTRLVLSLATLLLLSNEAQSDDRKKALGLYQAGRAHFLLKDYDKALEKFLEAYGHYQEPVLVQNLARCYEEMGKPVEAIKYFELFLGTKLARRERKLARDTQRRLKRLRAGLARLGSLRFVGGEPGISVRIDGRVIGTSPLEPQRLQPGTYVVQLKAPKRPALEHTVQLAPGGVAVIDLGKLFPAATTARLRIHGAIAGDQLEINGQKYGEVPNEALVLSAGEHLLLVRRSGHPPFRAAVELTPGGDHTVALAFQTQTATASGPGPWPWVVGGLGLAVAAGGIGFTVKANAEHADAVDFAKQNRQAEQEAAENARDQNDAIAIAMYSAGGAMLLTGVILYFVLDDSAPTNESNGAVLRPWLNVSPKAASMGASLSF